MSARPAGVTVVLPVYEAGPAVLPALERLERTLLPGSRVVVADDGSRDGTAQVVTDFCAGRPAWTLVVLPRNAGVAAARNAALALAETEHVWFVDWDDEWDEGILQALVDLAARTDADIAVTAAVHVDLDGLVASRVLDRCRPDESVLTGTQALAAMLRGELAGYLWNKLYRRELFGPVPFPAMSSQSDLAGNVALVRAARRVAVSPVVRYTHLVRAGSITNRAPRLENLARCHQLLLDAARDAGLDERGLLEFCTARVGLAGLNTALRLRADGADQALDRARRSTTWRSIRYGARVDAKTAAQLVLVRVLGRGYLPLFRAVKAQRARGRRLRPA